MKISENTEKIYEVSNFIDGLPHKYCEDTKGNLIFFIECVDNPRIHTINMEMFLVVFNESCLLTEGSISINKEYCFIRLNSSDTYIKKYFTKIIELMLTRLGVIVYSKRLSEELDDIIELFGKKKPFSEETLVGLWGELLVISKSADPSYLLNAWHVTKDDKYDFNDGKDKLEVKTTRKSKREHSFSLEQLCPNQDSELAVISIMMQPSDNGVSVTDLEEIIKSRIDDYILQEKLTRLIVETIGQEYLETAKSYLYDQPYAISFCKIFDYKDIPCIPREYVPAMIFDVKFKVCLEGLSQLDIINSNSQLIKLL